MKKLIIAATLGVFAVGALAQGQFQFGNRNPLAGIDAKVLDNFGAPLAGAAYWAQAYVKLTTLLKAAMHRLAPP